jgi:hypothetical protein
MGLIPVFLDIKEFTFYGNPFLKGSARLFSFFT